MDLPPLPFPRPAQAPASFHILIKPTGAQCNLNCTYCFYLDKARLYPHSTFRMSDELMRAYIHQLFEAHQGDRVEIAWQGGEPTLMGLDFFRRAVAYAENIRPPDKTLAFTIQTNGTRLDDDWCRFFKEHDFLVGISLDGPPDIHDAYRRDKGDRPTFQQVMRGIHCLQKHDVAFNVLTTVHRANENRPLDVYRFLRDEVAATWMQFIPIVERLPSPSHQPPQVAPESVHPEAYGRFLSAIFDEWVTHDVGRVFIQTFEAALANWLGWPSSGLCVFNETCGRALALEHNGDLYACDHFVDPQHRRGNITQTHLIELIASPQQRAFGDAKRDALPRMCQTCDVLFACRGGCPKNRFMTTPDQEPGLNYLCPGYQHFFRHIDKPMRLLAHLIRTGHDPRTIIQHLAINPPGHGSQA